jgi:tRNA(His) 5'-end guanylyltransferase
MFQNVFLFFIFSLNEQNCVITGLPAKYRDPKTMLPYANLEAYKELKRRIQNNELYGNASNRVQELSFSAGSSSAVTPSNQRRGASSTRSNNSNNNNNTSQNYHTTTSTSQGKYFYLEEADENQMVVIDDE